MTDDSPDSRRRSNRLHLSSENCNPSGEIYRRVRVFHCIDNFGIGGTELNAIRTLEILDRNRFEPALIALSEDGPLRSRYDRAQIPVYSFPISNLYGPAAVQRALELIWFMRRTRPDVVHCHDLYTNMFVTPCARVARVPLTITSRRWWTSLPRRVHAIGNRWAYRLSHLVIANSPAVASLLVESEGVDARRVAIISNFVDDASFNALDGHDRGAMRAKFGIPPASVVCAAVAMLRPEKDFFSLLTAIAHLAPSRPELHLLLIGSGPCEAELKAASQKLDIADRVHFAGYLPSLPNPHQFGDISVLCSLHEGFPNSIIEAMAVGKPVVATAVGGIPDAVQHEVTGLLVPPGAPRELAAAIDRLVGNPGLRKRFGDAGRARAKALYRADSVAAKLASLYLNGAKDCS